MASDSSTSKVRHQKILVTGSRDWTDYETLSRVLGSLSPTAIVHGDARGADTLAQRYADERDIETHRHPADWKRGRAAGIYRNIEMLRAHPDIGIVVAFPLPQSRGTHHMIRIARSKGLLIWIVGL